jgi:hypothetical protein
MIGMRSMDKKIDDLRRNEDYNKIKNWLSPPDSSTNYNKALGQRHKDSGTWLLHSDALIEWKTRSNSFLWLYGIPGCGKTILSSTIVEDLGKSASYSPILYFFFDFNKASHQSLEGMIRSLISQLYHKREDARKPLDLLFRSCGSGHQQPATESLCATFLDMIQEVGDIWIVQDALDECRTRSGSQTEGLLSWMKYLMTSKLANVHLLVTSRQEEDIESALKEWAPAETNIPINGDTITSDIRAYVRGRIHEDDDLKRWASRPQIQDKIETKLMAKADGM